eukprot:TRINITY_DN101075_c0_g1_i1.p1 TRINITY_DN101075_c0_g1~~TRINITY_DN101075_c0_g1_i1.p1  ORF type:complete len:689 (-),score=186.12 TRINITY_DN101075_c0_g1_i1:133-2199(-)
MPSNNKKKGGKDGGVQEAEAEMRLQLDKAAELFDEWEQVIANPNGDRDAWYRLRAGCNTEKKMNKWAARGSHDQDTMNKLKRLSKDLQDIRKHIRPLRQSLLDAPVQTGEIKKLLEEWGTFHDKMTAMNIDKKLHAGASFVGAGDGDDDMPPCREWVQEYLKQFKTEVKELQREMLQADDTSILTLKIERHKWHMERLEALEKQLKKRDETAVAPRSALKTAKDWIAEYLEGALEASEDDFIEKFCDGDEYEPLGFRDGDKPGTVTWEPPIEPEVEEPEYPSTPVAQTLSNNSNKEAQALAAAAAEAAKPAAAPKKEKPLAPTQRVAAPQKERAAPTQKKEAAVSPSVWHSRPLSEALPKQVASEANGVFEKPAAAVATPVTRVQVQEAPAQVSAAPAQVAQVAQVAQSTVQPNNAFLEDAPPAPPAVPPDWEALWSSEHKRYYFHNAITGISTWRIPQASSMPAAAPPKKPSHPKKPSASATDAAAAAAALALVHQEQRSATTALQNGAATRQQEEEPFNGAAGTYVCKVHVPSTGPGSLAAFCGELLQFGGKVQECHGEWAWCTILEPPSGEMEVSVGWVPKASLRAPRQRPRLRCKNNYFVVDLDFTSPQLGYLSVVHGDLVVIECDSTPPHGWVYVQKVGRASGVREPEEDRRSGWIPTDHLGELIALPQPFTDADVCLSQMNS